MGGQTRTVFRPTFYPSTTDIRLATPLSLSPGEDRGGIDINLNPVEGYEVSGRLIGPTTDYSGTLVSLTGEGLSDLGSGSETATTVAQKDGSFVFLNVAAGIYNLAAPGVVSEFIQRPATLTVRDRPLPENPGSGKRAVSFPVSAAPLISATSILPNVVPGNVSGYTRRELRIESADIRGLEVLLQPTATVQCEIITLDLEGGRPAGTTTLFPSDANLALGIYAKLLVPTDSSSSVTFSDVVPGDYFLDHSFAGLSLKSVVADGEDVTRGPIRIVAGQKHHLVVTLTGKAIKLSGHIVDGPDRRTEAAVVLLFPTDPLLWRPHELVPLMVRRSVSSTDRSYTVGGLLPGDYFIAAVSVAEANAWSVPGALRALSGSAARVTLAWGDDKSMDVPIRRGGK
jgi:hypothetical protein